MAGDYSEVGGAGKPGWWQTIDAARGALKGLRIDFSSMIKLRKSLGMPDDGGGGWAGWPQ
jgi:hypothetical protein